MRRAIAIAGGLALGTAVAIACGGDDTDAGAGTDASIALDGSLVADGAPHPGSIVEEFVDGGMLDPDGMTATLDPSEGGALVAPLEPFAPSDCHDGVLAIPDGGTLVLDGGVLQLASLDVPEGATLASQGSIDLRVCGDVRVRANGRVVSGGALRITGYGDATIEGALAGTTEMRLALAKPGATLRIRGAGTIWTPYDQDAGAGGSPELVVNGDITFDGNGSIYGEIARNAQGAAPLRIVSGGTLLVGGSAMVFTDEGNGPSGTSAGLSLRAKGDLLVGPGANVSVAARSAYRDGGLLEVAAGGSIGPSAPDQAGGTFFLVGGPSTLRVRAVGGVDLARRGSLLILAHDDAGPEQTAEIAVATNGTFTLGSEGSILTGESQALLPASSRVSVSAGAVILGDQSEIGSPGSAPDAGLTAITADIGDGGLTMAPLADFHFGPSRCAPGGSLRITTRGDVALSPDASVAAGDSIADDAGGCAAARGGDVVLTAGGAIDAGPVRAGAGSPPGTVTRTAGATIDAAVERVSLTEPFVAMSRLYDLGQPSVVLGMKTLLRRPIAEGGVTIELAAADAPAGPFTAWTTDPAALGKHRFLRWRATVDRYFFEGAALDRLEIDYQ